MSDKSSRAPYGLTSEMVTEFVLGHVLEERERQDAKWNRTPGDWTSSRGTKFMVLGEEVGEVARAVLESETPERLFAELVQVAAVAICWAESLVLQDDARPGRSAAAEIRSQQASVASALSAALHAARIGSDELVGPALAKMADAHRRLTKRSLVDEWIEERDGVRVRVKRYQVFR